MPLDYTAALFSFSMFIGMANLSQFSFSSHLFFVSFCNAFADNKIEMPRDNSLLFTMPMLVADRILFFFKLLRAREP